MCLTGIGGVFVLYWDGGVGVDVLTFVVEVVGVVFWVFVDSFFWLFFPARRLGWSLRLIVVVLTRGCRCSIESINGVTKTGLKLVWNWGWRRSD